MARIFFGFQSIDQKVTNLLRPIFFGNKKEFITLNNLVKNWTDIIGKKYAKFCYPKAVSFTKYKNAERKLTIAVYNPAAGFFLKNNSEIIIEKIAAFYGFKIISDIIIRQEPKIINTDFDKEIRLTKEKEEFLAAKILQITDHDLAQTLQKLGREIFRK
jgi:hypothetical protein